MTIPPMFAAHHAQHAAVQMAALQPDNCLDDRGMNTERRLSACSRDIDFGRLSVGELGLAHFNRGAAFAAMGNTARANADYAEALRLYDGLIDRGRPDAAPLARRATALQALGRIERALLDYNEAIRLDAGNVVALVGRGTLLVTHKGEHARAIADFDRVLALQPNTVDALVHRGDAWARTGEFDAALADIDRALALAPRDPRVLLFRGLANARRGDLRRATADYTAALALDPRNVDALVSRAAAYATDGKHDQAIVDLEAVLALQPDNVRALYNRGYVRFAQKQYDRAIDDYGQVSRLAPGLTAAYINRCLTLAIAGRDLAGGLGDCDSKLGAMPNDLGAREARGFIHLKLGDSVTALAEYDAALRVDPSRAVALYGRGLARIRTGNREGGEADRMAARALFSSIDRAFSDYGLE